MNAALQLNATQAQLARAFEEMMGARDALSDSVVPPTRWGAPGNWQALQDRYVWALGRYQAALQDHIYACVAAALATPGLVQLQPAAGPAPHSRPARPGTGTKLV